MVQKILTRYAVPQLVETLSYKPKGSQFDYPMGFWRFFTYSRTMALGSNQPLDRNEYRGPPLGSKGERSVRLTTLPHPCSDCQKSWEPQTSGALGAYIRRLVQGQLYLHLKKY